VQGYGRYFGLPTVSFRAGCLTGPAHAGTELHDFLSYLMICTVSGRPYRVFGYQGKQVRDNVHSFHLVEAFVEFVRTPRIGEISNIGHSRHTNCSMLEAIALCEEIRGRKLTWSYEETNGSATTSVGSAMSESFRSITQPGNFGAVCNISRGVVAWSVNAYGNLFLGNSPIICAADRIA
jgi:nucleoside-diphosphate-sugar epimerase